MAAQQAGVGIEEIYRGVISDVINQVREAFLDEGVDIEVLQQLKKSWESKIQASGAVDLEEHQPAVAPPPPPPAARQPRQQQQTTTTSSASTGPTPPAQPPAVPENVPSAVATSSSNPTQTQIQQPLMAQHTMNPVQMLSLPAQMLASSSAGAMQFPPGILPGTQYAIVDGPNGAPSLVLLNPQQMQLSLETQAQFILQQQQQQSAGIAGSSSGGGGGSVLRRPLPPEVATKKEPKHVPQLDGGGRMARQTTSTKNKNKKDLKKRIEQLDGGGPGMTDSSSEEEDDRLNRYAGLEDDELAEKRGGGKDMGDDDEDEEPLNSGDDQSDDEDLDTLFDADNIVVCQFEKVHRARNKWKFILKDGVMQLKGKDHCFHKSNGEAEW